MSDICAQTSLEDELKRQTVERELQEHLATESWVLLMHDGWVPESDTGTIVGFDDEVVRLRVNQELEVSFPRPIVTGVIELKHWREYITPGCDCKYCTTEPGTPGRTIMCRQKWDEIPREQKIEISESLED